MLWVLTVKSMTHDPCCVHLHVWYEVRVQAHFFTYGYSVVPVLLIEKVIFSSLNCLAFFVENELTTYLKDKSEQRTDLNPNFRRLWKGLTAVVTGCEAVLLKPRTRPLRALVLCRRPCRAFLQPTRVLFLEEGADALVQSCSTGCLENLKHVFQPLGHLPQRSGRGHGPEGCRLSRPCCF